MKCQFLLGKVLHTMRGIIELRGEDKVYAEIVSIPLR